MSRRIALVAIVTLLLTGQVAVAGISFIGAEPATVSARPEYLAAGDLNGDGLDDVAVISPQSDQLNVLVGHAESASRFGVGMVRRFGERLERLALGDLNADFRPDIAVADRGAGIVWTLIGRGDGTFVMGKEVPLGRNPFAVAIANFDKVPGNDLATADRRLGKVIIRLNDGGNPPGFRRGPEIEVGEQPEDVIAADFTGDGETDLLTLNMGGPRVKDVGLLIFKRVVQGFPDFEPVRRFGVGEKPSSLIAADFNNDGFPDLAMLNQPIGAGNSEVDVMLNRGDGTFASPVGVSVPCPFFTGGEFCPARALAAGDFDGNGNVDLAVALTDPRRARGTASAEADAMQVFSGRGDGEFVPGTVLWTAKSALAMVAADISGDGVVDLVMSAKRTSAVQAFINVTTPGVLGNGEECVLGEECLSGRCTNGVCCGTQCEETELCNVPGHEGVCTPVPDPIVCEDPRECESGFCVDSFCCDTACYGGRCDVAPYEGICILSKPDGEFCEEDMECVSGFCTNNVCCKERCDNGVCGDDGVCRRLRDNGEICDIDQECASNVCDEFDGICCDRRCDPIEEFCDEGFCSTFVTPTPTQPGTTPSQTGTTPSVTVTPGDIGDPCDDNTDCSAGTCVDNVCCEVEQCAIDEHCELGTGVCAPGTPKPTPTRTPTRIPSSTPDGGSKITTTRSGGCWVGGDGASASELAMLAMLPAALWLRRRWRRASAAKELAPVRRR